MPRGRVYNDITETIVDTPLVRLNRLPNQDPPGRLRAMSSPIHFEPDEGAPRLLTSNLLQLDSDRST